MMLMIWLWRLGLQGKGDIDLANDVHTAISNTFMPCLRRTESFGQTAELFYTFDRVPDAGKSGVE
jgi:hypothetical protein